MPELTEQAAPGLEETEPAAVSPACPACGTPLSQIYADGFLGCEECYKIFNDVVRQALASMHQTSRHTGKTL